MAKRNIVSGIELTGAAMAKLESRRATLGMTKKELASRLLLFGLGLSDDEIASVTRLAPNTRVSVTIVNGGGK